MAKPHSIAQDLARKVQAQGRRILVSELRTAIADLDKLYAGDAEALKKALRVALRPAGLSAARMDRVIDTVLTASRAQRVAIVEDAVRAAAKTARALDEKTFNAVFGGEPETPDPKAGRRSGSPRIAKRSLRLVNGSGGESA